MSIYWYIFYIHAAPSAPLNLTFSPGDVLNDSITFTWLPPEEPNGVVQFYQLKQSSSAGVIYVNTTYNTTIVLSNLVPGTQYNFSVRAFTVAFGPFSAQLSVHTADGEDSHCGSKEWSDCVIVSWVYRSSCSHCLNILSPCTILLSVPSVPQGVSAIANGSTSLAVTWMAPAVFFREHIHKLPLLFMSRGIHEQFNL